MRCSNLLTASATFAFATLVSVAMGAAPDLVLFNGKIATVDQHFTIANAMAVTGDRITRVGNNRDVLADTNSTTQRIDLKGQLVIPGLIDSHVHPMGAATYEFDHSVPSVASIKDVLAHIKSRADALGDGEWIRVQQMFITRLAEQRFPTRRELDAVAPRHPVIYRTGPDLAVNSLALERSGIDESFELPVGASGRIERDAQGRLNGIIRGASSVIKYEESQSTPSDDERDQLIEGLFRDYNSVGITSISDRNSNEVSVNCFRRLKDLGRLTCRVYLYYGVDAQLPPDEIRQQIEDLADHPLRAYDNLLWLNGVKLFLDGGMLTGSAYMLEPWGRSEIYSISDPNYRGTLKISPERLFQIARVTISNGLQMTAHSVGDGAVKNLIDAYEQVDRTLPVRKHRPCITHCNFMSADSIQRMQRLGIVADLQPAWLYLDGATLLRQFGDQRLRYFQPYRSLFEHNVVVGGGSDHMQKIGSLRSVNPYNPFLGMWITLSRMPHRGNTPLHTDERLNRQQALRLYTTNNAFLTFEEDRKGSLEVGKLADFVILDRDILTCPLDELRHARALRTYLGGKLVYGAQARTDPSPPDDGAR